MDGIFGGAGTDTLNFDMNSSDMDFISANGGFEYTPLTGEVCAQLMIGFTNLPMEENCNSSSSWC